MINPWRIKVLTLFPEMFPGFLGHSLAGKALEKNLWTLEAANIRSFAKDKHGTVDDTPFGGGPGMVMRPDILDEAIRAVQKDTPTNRLIYLTPRGKVLNQELVHSLAASPGLTLLCGRYEGVDERVLQAHHMEEISLGDFVLSGGEPAALVLLDACLRLRPGVLGNEETTGEESFENGLLEYPHYTRPATWKNAQGTVREVPEVLVSGNHAKVKAWRLAEAERTTQARRPDLWAGYMKGKK